VNESAIRRLSLQNKNTAHLVAATIRPNGWLLIDNAAASADKRLVCCLRIFPGI
jgi:hypothetical protein